MNTFIIYPIANLTILFMLKGLLDAIMYSRKGDLAFTWNEHIPSNITRIYWWFLLISGMITGFWYGSQNYPVSIIGLDATTTGIYIWLGFSFWHNGVYEYSKSKINKSNLTLWQAWKHLSPNDTAKTKQDFASRTYTLIFSLIIVVVNIIIKINLY